MVLENDKFSALNALRRVMLLQKVRSFFPLKDVAFDTLWKRSH